MERHYVTTPFGRRPMTLAMVTGQLAEAEIPTGKRVDKWKVFRDLCDAREKLGLRDRALAVLNALLSFFPETELEEGDNLIVFPSNAQLSVRANGIAGTTLRENLGILVDGGIVSRRDSPNGKRYARKDGQGEIRDAYGFSLAPLLVRAEEFALLAQEAAAERRHLQMLRERITILRRDVRKLVAAAIEEGAKGDWLAIEAELVTELFDLKRKKTIEDLQKVAERLADLHARALNMLELRAKNKKSAANASEIRDHIQNSTTESSNDSEPALNTGRAAAICPTEPLLETKSATAAEIPTADARKPLPLSAVTRACPDIRAYGPGGAVENWRELMAAAVVVRSMLGVSPSAYEEACAVMGPENAAITLACMLERAGHIQSPGGYLRDLTRRAARGQFSVGPMVMAAARARGVIGAAKSPLPS